MFGRLVSGIIKGALLGGALAAIVVWGLGLPVWPVLLAYVVAAGAGALTGVVAGKPIWAEGAKVEVLLKSVVGAIVAVVALFGARKWLPHVSLDLGFLGAGAGSIGELPAAFLPMVTTALAMLFELDDSGESSTTASGPRRRVMADAEHGAELEADEASVDVASHRPARKRHG